MNQLMYSFRDNDVRVVIKDNEPWFMLKDICKILEINNPSDVVKRIPNKNIHLDSIDGNKGYRNAYLINEYGVYEVIFSSRKKQANDFKKWVFEEVLPSIRKHGIYATEDVTKKVLENPQFMIELLQNLQKEREEKQDLNNKLNEQRPKVLFAECVEDSGSTILIGDFSKILKQNGVDIGQNRLFKYLRENGYLIKRERYHYPTQKSMNLGIFRLTERLVNTPKGSVITPTVKVTGKGQVYLTNKFLKEIK